MPTGTGPHVGQPQGVGFGTILPQKEL